VLRDDCAITGGLRYLNEHYYIQINGEEINMELQSANIEDDYFIIFSSAPFYVDTIEELRIQNKCFYEFDDQFKNRIILDANDIEKSFLLNKERDQLNLN